MRILILAAMVLVSQNLSGSPKDAANSPFKIVISTEAPVVEEGDPLTIKIALTNLSQVALNCSTLMERAGLDGTYQYIIRDPKGKLLARIAPRHPGVSSFWPCTLGPGDTVVRDVRLTAERFNTKDPGAYTIQVSRANEFNPDGPRILSNVISVTVKPAN